MTTSKKGILYSHESKITQVEQIINDLSQMRSDISNNFIDLRKELKEMNGIFWNKLEFLDKRINDNFKYLLGIIVALLSGLYATALGDMVLRLTHWI
jgi:hypothetical protein